ncbi:Kae1-associated serine/threonine protein kinase [Candidatus Pacearchaeota archaeon]|nr:Kae1-associated serine/threonine protein kinase [Candidatus Pacearchaeota archaeon]
MNNQIIAHGAEAIIIKERNNLIKRRIKKGYRVLQLDEKLRKQRTKKEAKLMEKASRIINVPKIIKIDDYDIELQEIKGKKLSEYLEKLDNKMEICKEIGVNIRKLHDENIIHGDLTTSNMILGNEIVYFIDFGLGFESVRSEDKAVDLHVLKEALEARHFSIAEKCWKEVLSGYNKSKNAKEVLKQLEKVEQRGRYKGQY